MSKCYVCGEEINKENETEEHILLNSIGGTLKSKTLICKKCNSEFGEKIDVEIAKQLNYFSNMLNIKRDRGKPPNLELKSKETGEKILLKPGGKPVRKISKINKDMNGKNNKIEISISAPSIKEARKTLCGLKRKYPSIDIEETLNNKIIKERKYLKDTYITNFKFGGDITFRSICKTAINFYMYNCGERQYIEHLVPYIKGQKKIDCVNFYYPNSDIIYKNPNEVLHSIIIKGNHEQKLLFAYIELFNFYKFVVLLNNKYDGNDVNIGYYFDVLERREVNKSINFNIQKNEIIKHLGVNPEKIIKEINKLQKIIINNQFYKEIDSISQEARENSFKKYPEDMIITSKMSDEFADELMKRINPFIGHVIKKRDKYS